MADQKTSQTSPMPLPELLAPAGDFSALQAAISHGADAVYLGASAFSARRQAANFAGSQLSAAIQLAHLHGLRVYLALNTLVLDSEIDQALSVAGTAAEAGVDAVILQDTGLVRLLHGWLPDLPLHASTQMTVTDAAGLHLAARLGFSRVILARELQLDEIRDLTEKARALQLETEVFIHGALCMGLSGQCLLSSLSGGRSGNRGDCAQPCRLEWTLSPAKKSDGQPFPWLSPCDQSLLPASGPLASSGVAAFKIEGRMRGPAYVGPVVAVYREVLDRIREGNPPDAATLAALNSRLLLAFNRGGRFSSRPLSGQMGRDFLAGRYSGSHGLLIGTVSQADTRTGSLTIRQSAGLPGTIGLSRGDILSVRTAGDSNETASAPIGKIEAQPDGWAVRGFHPDILRKICAGQSVYLMSSRRAEAIADRTAGSKTQLSLQLAIQAEAIQITAEVLRGPAAGTTVQASLAVEPIEPLQAERVRRQLMKTGGTPFEIERIDGLAALRLSIASLNALRRNLLDTLSGAIEGKLKRTLPPKPDRFTRPDSGFRTDPQPAVTASPIAQPDESAPAISAYFYRLPASPEELPCGADQYLLPILSLSAQTAATWTAAIRARENARILAWIPASRYGRLSRLLPGLLAGLSDWGFDGVCAGQSAADLTENLTQEHKQLAAGWLWSIDSSANVYNSQSLAAWLAEGASAVCPSVELDEEALITMLRNLAVTQNEGTAPPVVEIPAYGHLRAMNNAFCPVGFNEAGCRRCLDTPQADRNTDTGRIYTLKDRRGFSYPLLTHPRVCQSELLHHDCRDDPGLANRIRRQAGADIRILTRLNFLDETRQERCRLIEQYRTRSRKP